MYRDYVRKYHYISYINCAYDENVSITEPVGVELINHYTIKK